MDGNTKQITIPEELRSKKIWLRWKLEVRKGKPTKVPYRSGGKGYAKTNDPSTWSTFTDACKSKIGNGVGCVVNDGLVAIDLDKVRDSESGVIEPWVEAIIRELDSYTELSPSGRGVHIWVRGEVPPGGNRRGRMEMYDRNSPRFMTVTGRVIHDVPIRARDLMELHRRMLAGADPHLQGTKADSNGDHSAADFAFCCQLAKQGKTADEIDAALRASSLFRPKWEERRGQQTYGQITISKAFQSTTNVQPHNGSKLQRRLHIVSGVDVKRKIQRFLWDPVFPLGTLVHFCGKSSQGKSPVTIDLLARITTGREWPDGQPNLIGPRDVLLLAIEDNLDDIIMPRFDAAGGDETRFHHCDVTHVVDKNGKLHELMVALDQDIHVLCEQARSIPELGAIVIDPISNYLGKISMNREAEVRSLLMPLARLADELKILVLTVGHYRKGSREVKDDPLSAVMGASAFHGVARAVWALGPDSEEEDPYRHIMAPSRAAGKSFKYHTELSPWTIEGEQTKVLKVIWDGTCKATAEDAVNPLSRDDKSKIAGAAVLLKEFLRTGKRPASDCIKHLEENGFSNVNTVYIRRKARVGSEQKAGCHWWYLEAGKAVFPQYTM